MYVIMNFTRCVPGTVRLFIYYYCYLVHLLCMIGDMNTVLTIVLLLSLRGTSFVIVRRTTDVRSLREANQSIYALPRHFVQVVYFAGISVAMKLQKAFFINNDQTFDADRRTEHFLSVWLANQLNYCTSYINVLELPLNEDDEKFSSL